MPTAAPNFHQLPGQAPDPGTNLRDNITGHSDIINAGPVFAKPINQSLNSFTWGSQLLNIEQKKIRKVYQVLSVLAK